MRDFTYVDSFAAEASESRLRFCGGRKWDWRPLQANLPKVNPETADVDQLRAHVARHESYLRTHPNTGQVRQVAANIAAAVAGDASPLIAEARALPPVQSLVPPHGTSSPTARDERFDAAVEQLIDRYYLAIDEIEDFQQRLKANETIDDDDVVAAVLAHSAKETDVQWSSVLSWPLALPAQRILDALEELQAQGAVEIKHENVSHNGNDGILRTLLFQVTAHGRRVVRGTAKPRSIVPAVQVTQHIYDSSIASAGVSYGNVEQHVTINPDVRDVIEALAQFEAALRDDPRSAAAITLAQSAAQELRTNGWGEKAGTLLRAIPATLGGVTALAANAKPAYELVRGFAGAHGVVLPPLP